MAEKKTKSAKSPAATKAPRKPAKKPHEHHDHEHCGDEDCSEIEIELDDTEHKTVNMFIKSAEMRVALENEASTALAAAVRKLCRQYGTPLSAAQAHNVAMVLFNG